MQKKKSRRFYQQRQGWPARRQRTGRWWSISPIAGPAESGVGWVGTSNISIALNWGFICQNLVKRKLPQCPRAPIPPVQGIAHNARDTMQASSSQKFVQKKSFYTI